jgi:DNA topoisomerase-1
MALQEFEKFDSAAQAKKNVVRAIESVAERLGNTPSVCRKCYVHPAVLDAYLEGATLQVLRERAEEELSEELPSLQPEEAAVLAMLQERLAHEEANPRPPTPPPRARKKRTTNNEQGQPCTNS